MSTFTTYLSIANHLSRYETMTAADPTVAQATKYYQAHIGSVTTPKQLVNNPRLFNYVMNAFGLGDKTYAKALIQKVLEQGTSSSRALANTLNDPNILALAKAFNFAQNGAATTRSAATTTDVVDKYVMQTLGSNEGNQNPGVKLALYFQQHASSITDGYSILADKNLLTVVQSTLGLSPYTSVENVDRQAKQFDGMLTYSNFQKPSYVRNFLERFAAQYDLSNANGSPSSSTSTIVSPLLTTATARAGFSARLLMSLQNFKLGGA